MYTEFLGGGQGEVFLMGSSPCCRCFFFFRQCPHINEQVWSTSPGEGDAEGRPVSADAAVKYTYIYMRVEDFNTAISSPHD